jgi:3-deoxy-D-arabino-heptulosonate 7-phosphate (DAHP) synthase
MKFSKHGKFVISAALTARGYNTVAAGVDFVAVGADNGQGFVRISTI